MVNFFVKNSPPEAAYVGVERVGAMGGLCGRGKSGRPLEKLGAQVQDRIKNRIKNVTCGGANFSLTINIFIK